MAKKKIGTIKITRKVTLTQNRKIVREIKPIYSQPINTTISAPVQKQLSSGIKRYVRPNTLPTNFYSPQVATVYEEFNKRQKSEEDEKSALYDVFISHASEDKQEFVNELVEVLQEAGIRVWYDTIEMQWGKSLREQIDSGIKRSKFAIVVLSHNFFAKKWTMRELDGILVKEEISGSAPLPIWHNISYEEVYELSPTLSGLFALSTEKLTTQDICNALMLVLEKEEVKTEC